MITASPRKPSGEVPKTDPAQPGAPVPVPPQPPISDPPPQGGDPYDPPEPQPVD
jgi:hypothetical protein